MARFQGHYTDSVVITKLGKALYRMLEPAADRSISLICIGTDRATGDALGPLVGRTLSALRLPVRIYGTLKQPVGANNLAEALADAKARNDFVIAVDASLGQANDVGKITAWRGSLRPGTGVGKTLPPIGDVSILGCVNVNALAPMQVLQCTRLDTVMEMAEVISFGLSYAIRRHVSRLEAQPVSDWRPLPMTEAVSAAAATS